MLPLVLQRLLSQAAATGAAATLSVVLRFVLPQTGAGDSTDTVQMVLRRLLFEAAHSAAA
jgi:hypothetical protein